MPIRPGFSNPAAAREFGPQEYCAQCRLRDIWDPRCCDARESQCGANLAVCSSIAEALVRMQATLLGKALAATMTAEVRTLAAILGPDPELSMRIGVAMMQYWPHDNSSAEARDRQRVTPEALRDLRDILETVACADRAADGMPRLTRDLVGNTHARAFACFLDPATCTWATGAHYRTIGSSGS